MRKLIKRLLIFAFILLLIPVVGLFLLKVSPHSFIKLSQHFHGYDISAEKVDISLLSPTININALTVRNQQGVQLFHTDKLSLSSQWRDLFFGNKNRGIANIKDSIIHIEPITQSFSANGTNKKAGGTTQVNDALNIHQLLQLAHISLSGIQLKAPNNTHIHIITFESFSSDNDTQVGINFDLSYQQNDVTIPLKGKFLSVSDSPSEPQLLLHINELDIAALSAIKPNNSSHNKHKESNFTATVSSTGDTHSTTDSKAINSLEKAIDWSPLQQFTPLDFSLKIDKIQLTQGEATDLTAHFHIKNTAKNSKKFIIDYKQSVQLAIDINKDLSFTGPLTVNAQWKTLNSTTTGADIKGKTTIMLADDSATFDGLVNLNGVNTQDISVDISLEQFPFTASSVSTKNIQQQSTEFFPLTTSSQLQLNNGTLSLTDLSLKAGKSDLKGHLSINFRPAFTSLKSIEFDFKSAKIFLPENKKTVSQIPSSKPKATQATRDNKLFTNDAIDSSILNTVDTKGTLDVGKIYYGNRILLAGLNSSLSLQQKSLLLNSKIDSFAKGKVDTNISIKDNNGQLQLVTTGSIRNLLLESLAWLPKDEFTGGKTNISFSLNSQGNSTKALASRLQGDFLFSSENGTIANNSFELIGSDLLLNLVNTINPFYKKAKNTQLECAVIKSSIKDGKMQLDDSIAIKTSKMIIVADGNINLEKERINLGINPKARAGVGIDIASLAKFIALKGSLTNPSIGISAEGSLKSALQLGAAISSGGLSLITSGIADKVISTNACKLAQNAFTH